MRINKVRRRGWILGLALVVAAGVAACDDDGPSGPAPLPIETIAGRYDITAFSFDPQGSAPAANVLQALQESGQTPTLNIAQRGTFQLFYTDPISGEVEVINGEVELDATTVELIFPSQAAADPFLLPEEITLGYDEADGALSFTGATEVDRSRLLQLFPELYGDEQFLDPTPGTLSVRFQRTAG